MSDLMWCCEICGRNRPDELIKVATYQCGLFTRNVKYCVDNVACGDAARLKAVRDAEAMRAQQDELSVEERVVLVRRGFGPTLADIDGLEVV